MARLETQINQIYLTNPKTSTVSLILYEDSLTPSTRLFYIAELTDIRKKTEKDELKKISDIVVQKFQNNKKALSDELFETLLSQINNDLAELARGGKKSWLGKFSSLLVIKSHDAIYLTNTGQTTALLKRGPEMIEILPSEKRGLHPLKIFLNFTIGKLQNKDQLILTTSNLLNFLAIDRLGDILSQHDSISASAQITSILKDSLSDETAFCGFLLDFSSSSVQPPAIQSQTPVYAPMPEDMIPQEISLPEAGKIAALVQKFRLPAIPRLPIRTPRLPSFEFWKALSGARKFFLASFAFFLVILIINIGVYLVRNNSEAAQARIQTYYDRLLTQINEAESAQIYQNDEAALLILSEAGRTFEELKKLSESRALELEPKLREVTSKINRISVIANPAIKQELKYNPANIMQAGSSFIFYNQDPKSLTRLANGQIKDIFMLNKPNGDLVGLAHVPNFGNIAATKTALYAINETEKQFSLFKNLAEQQLNRLKYLSPNRVYAINYKTNQIVRFAISDGRISDPQNVLKNPTDLSTAVDLGLDAEVYVLFPDQVRKYSSGNLSSFAITHPSDPVVSASRIQIGASSIYILEPAKKRLIIYSKTGRLVNQLVFPSLNSPFDMLVDETRREIHILDDNKLYLITF